ncbi:MAG: bifunctional glutamate N-acetyltransferase/amino-acid acetyltransferase ArgJ, partial [Gammaproteobacteria bacterium]|nr:bifunctional glutamate N-acetyltransferase/amino-acid acetyltransferase ArgJ [Gammaproteobacteria bacterium]
MAVNSAVMPELHPVAGVRLASVACGIKKSGVDDLVLMELAKGSTTAAVFTQNAFCAAPVTLAKAFLAQHSPRYWLINSGNANAGTGQGGLADAQQCCAWLATEAGVTVEQVLPFSTGVIGERLPMSCFQLGIPQALTALHEDRWAEAAQGIMTTDTCAKGFSEQFEIAGQTVTITGIAKGSGMIHPNMATMLAYLATDVEVSQEDLQQALQTAVKPSFNSITVDGDTSTNDACLLVATGQSGLILDQDSEHWPLFQAALNEACKSLALAIVRDAEGATKFITLQVDSGRNEDECRQVAFTIAHSPLVKTAFFASDPNWGRILAAVGRSGLPELDVEQISIYLDHVCIVRNG